MSSPELCHTINRDISEKKLISILCSCSIEYEGRSKSTIGLGHRIIILKQDSTLLIHSVCGFKPVNWMNTPTETVAEYSENLILHSQRTKKPFEEMRIIIHEVIDYSSYENLRDKEKLDLIHTEKELQDHLAKNPTLVHPEFRLISTERQSPLGFFDLYGKIGETYTVVELKIERAGLPAALQVKRYRDWLRDYIGEAHGILVAPSITPNALTLIKSEGMEFRKMSIKQLDVKRSKDKTLREWFEPDP